MLEKIVQELLKLLRICFYFVASLFLISYIDPLVIILSYRIFWATSLFVTLIIIF